MGIIKRAKLRWKLRLLKSELIELDWDREFCGVPKADIWHKEHCQLEKEIKDIKEKL